MRKAQFWLSRFIMVLAVGLCAACDDDEGPVADAAALGDGGTGDASATSDAGADASGGDDLADTDAPPLSQRSSAATQTALTNAQCTAIQPFYWEVGDGAAALAAGSSPAGDLTYQADTSMQIASASKWIYSSYFVQRVGGHQSLSPQDLSFFNFQSGYTNFSFCAGADTVASCAARGMNGVVDPATLGKFDYGGGHMQAHAAGNGLGLLNNVTLATEMKAQLGGNIGIAYKTPQLAGGAEFAPMEYTALLRKIVGGGLLMREALGTHQVCASPNVCPNEAVSSPAPPTESWRYSVGHWVEDTANVSDGAFSSPGAFGFYPWIDKTRSYYGVVARHAIGGALTSVYCGRLIRKAFLTGVAQ